MIGQYATEDYQATWYLQMLDLLACDPNVRVVNIFHLVDEPNLPGWQSGLYFVDRTAKQSAQVVEDWIAQTGGRCLGAPCPGRRRELVQGRPGRRIWGRPSRPLRRRSCRRSAVREGGEGVLRRRDEGRLRRVPRRLFEATRFASEAICSRDRHDEGGAEAAVRRRAAGDRTRQRGPREADA